jgi:uncharacterized membrane protein HdeD (DUF308 family)
LRSHVVRRPFGISVEHRVSGLANNKPMLRTDARRRPGASPPSFLKLRESMMTLHASSSPASQIRAPAPWARSLLGVVLIVAGILVLGDAVAATIISAIFIGAMAIIAGGFEVVHAFWTKGWGGFAWQIILGLLYIAFGITLVTQPVAGALALTYVFGLLLIVSGALRIGVGFRHGVDWIMVLSGAFGILAGLIILSGWPLTGLWFLGFLLGLDLIFHGVAWLLQAWQPAARAT